MSKSPSRMGDGLLCGDGQSAIVIEAFDVVPIAGLFFEIAVDIEPPIGSDGTDFDEAESGIFGETRCHVKSPPLGANFQQRKILLNLKRFYDIGRRIARLSGLKKITLVFLIGSS